MGRRSDHSREELRDLIVAEGRRQLARSGYARFSARAVAKAIGYSIGTIYNVFGSHHALMFAINARTVAVWTESLRARLDAAPPAARISALVGGYFDFALRNRHAWGAIYDHRIDDPADVPADYIAIVGELTGLVRREVQAALPDVAPDAIAALTRSLLAVVHGHCVFAIDGTFAQLGEGAPEAAALARVREALAAAT